MGTITKIEGHGRPTAAVSGTPGTVYTDLDTGLKYEFVDNNFIGALTDTWWRLIDPEHYKFELGGAVSWNDLEGKPFYTSEPVETAVVNNQTFTFDSNGAEVSCDALNNLLTEGDTVTVIWDGVTYFCTVYKCYYDSFPCVGDPSLWWSSEKGGNNEPFFIYTDDDGNAGICAESSGEHTVTVYIPIVTVVRIPDEYLPASAFTGLPIDGGGEIFNDYDNNIASGLYSHAEGCDCTVTVLAGHAEGHKCTVTGDYGHAEGDGCTVIGVAGHAEGLGTIASVYQHVQGKYNIEDTEKKYAHIVGNGENTIVRSNAHTLDWDGNARYAGTVEGTAMIVASSTEGSTKRFKITVDDSGTITATEVTE